MPKFTILWRVDAYVDYVAEVEAEFVEAAVDIAYDDLQPVKWEERGIVELDARRGIRGS